jgi:predicted secreted hydrolase
MVYSLRGTTPSAGYLSGTIVRNGTSSTLTSDDVTIEVLQRWRSQKTGTEYPARWRVSVPSIGYSAVLTPLVAHQEMVGVDGATPTYWEGAAVSEDRRSLAYVELTGYGTPLNKLL